MTKAFLLKFREKALSFFYPFSTITTFLHTKLRDCLILVRQPHLSPHRLRGIIDSLHSFCPKPQKESKSLFRLAPPAGVSACAAKSNKLATLKQYLIFNAALRLALYPPA
jgi:hypothetical protein